MKLKHREIIRLLDTLNELNDKEMPVMLTYKFIENTDALIKVYLPYQKTIEKLKDKNDDETFKQEADKLLEVEKEVEITPIINQELIDAELKVTPRQLDALKKIIEW